MVVFVILCDYFYFYLLVKCPRLGELEVAQPTAFFCSNRCWEFEISTLSLPAGETAATEF